VDVPQTRHRPLIGTRTWGGLIGIGGYPQLMDGAQVTAPRWALYNPETGQFDVENIGVAPDIEIDLDPALWRQGHDPQPKKASRLLSSSLKSIPRRPSSGPSTRSTTGTSSAPTPRRPELTAPLQLGRINHRR
jgi:tricorn protease